MENGKLDFFILEFRFAAKMDVHIWSGLHDNKQAARKKSWLF